MANDKTDTNKKRMIEALELHKGIVTDAAKAAGICRDSHYTWLKDDPEYKLAVDALSDVALDFVEGKLFKNIEEGDTTGIIFYLKTKGKKRGYIEKTEQDINLKGLKLGKDVESYE